MPVIIDKSFINNTRLAVWHITEAEDQLHSRLQLNKEEESLLKNIKVEKKRLQWLSSRCLIRFLMNTPEFISMHSGTSGQPLFSAHSKKVSISHAGNFAAVIISNESEVGIDIEVVSDNVMKIKHKFIGDDEMKWMSNEKGFQKHLIIWSAKESMFKWYAKGEVDFRENLLLNKFELEKQGTIKAVFEKDFFIKELIIHYEMNDEFVLTYLIQ